MQRVGAVLALVLLGGCYSSPPKFWEAACRDETGERRYETPEPAGLVVPTGVQAFDTLLVSGASWVEANVYGVGGKMAELYPQGRGRYALRLTRLSEPACQAALREEGYDPTTLSWTGQRGEPIYKAAELACASAEWLGDAVDPEPPSSGIGGLSLEQRMEGWSAPYIILGSGEIDPRSEPDDPVYRQRIQVLERATGKPIMELLGFSYTPKTNWFPAIMGCGVPGWLGREQIPTRVFQAKS